jgi:acetyltransferase-like isoleucine patch superfamily enzyme
MSADDSVYVHPQGLCESDDVGPGTRIWAFAHVMAGAVVGAGCNICDHVFVEAGARVGNRVTVKNAVLIWDRVVIEDDVFLGPNVTFTNDLRPRARIKRARNELLDTRVRQGATIGANATIVCGVDIGEHGFVAAGAVVTKDVPAHGLIVGNPGRQIGWVCECGRPVTDLTCCECGRPFDFFSNRSARPSPPDAAADAQSVVGSRAPR